jgi:hypothetical protein
MTSDEFTAWIARHRARHASAGWARWDAASEDSDLRYEPWVEMFRTEGVSYEEADAASSAIVTHRDVGVIAAHPRILREAIREARKARPVAKPEEAQRLGSPEVLSRDCPECEGQGRTTRTFETLDLPTGKYSLAMTCCCPMGAKCAGESRGRGLPSLKAYPDLWSPWAKRWARWPAPPEVRVEPKPLSIRTASGRVIRLGRCLDLELWHRVEGEMARLGPNRRQRPAEAPF